MRIFYFSGISELIHFLEAGGLLKQPPLCPDEIFAIMRGCWNMKPRERPTFKLLNVQLDTFECDLHDKNTSLSNQLAPNDNAPHPPKPFHLNTYVSDPHDKNIALNNQLTPDDNQFHPPASLHPSQDLKQPNNNW